MLAVQSRNEELIAFILEQSANPFFYDCLSKTALDYANFLNDDRKNEIVRQIAVAQGQWREQIENEADLLADQRSFPEHCTQFIEQVNGNII